MTAYKVVLVPFPFDDLSSSKVRPAVCLTNPTGEYRHVVLAFITSKSPAAPLSTDMTISRNSADFSSTGLRVSSTLRLHRMMTVSTSIIRRELGQFSPELKLQVQERLRLLFDL